jgi:hypothetical protein
MAEITIEWPAELNEHGRELLWFGSWLVGDDGTEGAAFYSGRGGAREAYPVPPAASGLRIRKWPNEGFDPEYADVLSFDGVFELRADSLDFDVRQKFSMLPEEFA